MPGQPPLIYSKLVSHLKLQVEGCADPLHLSDLFPRYVSANLDDKFFGAEHDILKVDLAGTSTFINPPFSGRVTSSDGNNIHIILALLRRWAGWCKKGSPTRGVFLIPEPRTASGREFVKEAERLGGVRFFSSDFDCFAFLSPEAFRHDHPCSPGPYGGRVHLFLFQNPSAAATDPISSNFFAQLDRWATRESLKYEIFPVPDPGVPLAPFRFQMLNCPISLFPSLNRPCPKQILELPVAKEVKDFLLSITPADPIPLLGGFLPFPLDRLLRKRCIDYKREIVLLRNEIVVIVSRAVWFKLALSKEITSAWANGSILAKEKSDSSSGRLNSKVPRGVIDIIPSLSVASPVGHSDKDAVHCDRLKRFKATPTNSL